MRTVQSAAFSVALTICLAITSTDRAIAGDGTLTGFLRDLAKPGSTAKARQADDDAKCRQYGFRPQTDGYANCRLKLDQARAANDRVRGSEPEGLSLPCKDALSRRDGGGTFIHC